MCDATRRARTAQAHYALAHEDLGELCTRHHDTGGEVRGQLQRQHVLAALCVFRDECQCRSSVVVRPSAMPANAPHLIDQRTVERLWSRDRGGGSRVGSRV
jgi:hypothetical protein